MNKILTEGFKVNKQRNNEWLGHGIYLFKYKVDAESWAARTYYCKPNPEVIKCFVEVEEEEYLDLDDPEKLNDYDRYYKQALEFLSKNGKSLIFKDKYEAMCWGLNMYKYDNNIEAIKYTFKNNRTKNIMKYGNNKNGYKYNEVQICISKNETIINKESICKGG